MQFSSKMSAGIYIRGLNNCIVVLKLWTCWVIILKEGSEKNSVTAQKLFPLYWNSILCCKSHWNTKIDLWACVGKDLVGVIGFYFKSSHHCVCLSVWRRRGTLYWILLIWFRDLACFFIWFHFSLPPPPFSYLLCVRSSDVTPNHDYFAPHLAFLCWY